MVIPSKNLQLLTLGLGFQALITLTAIAALPNIRIQVNNENLHSPPYLLEALKQVEASQNNTTSNSGNLTRTTGQLKPILSANHPDYAGNHDKSDHRKQYASTNKTNDENEETIHNEGGEPAVASSFSVVKEETIEEILDLDPESVLKLLPEGLINGTPSSDYSRIADMAASETNNQEKFSANADEITGDTQESKLPAEIDSMVNIEHDNAAGAINRKPQLPTTNAHLKKPSLVDNDEQPGGHQQTSAANGDSLKSIIGSWGPKSLVSPSVVVDENPPPAPSHFSKKDVPMPPDTWEPSQVMNVTNASLVPATVTKDYGHQTRTRITLGGGYVRDKLPQLVNPASSAFVDDKTEKPDAPQERPRQSGSSQSSSSAPEISRVIEIPERIVLSESVFSPSSSASSATNNNKTLEESLQPVGNLDSRCPKKGIMTLEHPTACDKYFYCEDGFLSEQVCPNGLMYGTRDMVKDYCVHRWKATCDDKTVPNPISSPGCRWQYGIFSVQGSPKCSPDFYECTAGKFEVKKCSIDGQVYNDRTKSCQFAEQVGCAKEALNDFQCPPDDQGNTYWPFPRYFLNERALIHCVNDKPSIVRCTNDERVDPEHLHCVPLSKLKLSQPNVNLEERKNREKKKKSQ